MTTYRKSECAVQGQHRHSEENAVPAAVRSIPGLDCRSNAAAQLGVFPIESGRAKMSDGLRETPDVHVRVLDDDVLLWRRRGRREKARLTNRIRGRVEFAEYEDASAIPFTL